MLIVFLDIQQIQFNIPLWTQKYLRTSVIRLADSILPHLQQKPSQSFTYIDQISLAELMPCIFFLGNCLLQCEIVVICVGV